MRLSPFQVQAIKSSAIHAFGGGVSIYLFGSRVDDKAKGGDIDLFVETDLEKGKAMLAQLKFVVALQKKIGEQKVDVIVQSQDTDNQPVFQEARRTGVLL